MAGTANSTFVFPGPRPGSPTKEDLKPNAHPYPIRTTSTGVLSRSNSMTSRGGNQHSYVPSSPNPTTSPPKKMNGSGHRYNRSLSNDGPRPLPIPPPSPSATSSNNSVHSLTESPTRHSSPLPTPPGASPSPSLSVLDSLPVSPKSWTPSQLALYLATTLRARSGETFQLPAPVAQDIANFVRESKITGRSFLRMKDEDLEQFEINKLWRTALLSASRSLRQSVLKGRIWGFGNTTLEDPLASPLTASSSEDSDDYAVRGSDDYATMRSRPSSVRGNPFANEVAASSTEDFNENSTPRRQARVGRYRNGRVQGMVQHLERSGSESSPTRHERSNSVSSNGSFYDTAADGDAYETVKQPEREPVSSTESDTFDTVKDGKNRPLPPPPSDGNDSDQLSMDELLKRAGILPRDAEKFVNSRRKASKKVVAPQDLGDTSMEELEQAGISSQEGSKSNRKRKATTGRIKKGGVHAWEEDGMNERVTMRRALPMPIPAADIFASQATMYAAEEAEPAEGPVPPVEPMLLSEPMDAVKLEMELEETRAMVKALKRRIESVEIKVANMEAAERSLPAPVFPPGSIMGRLLGRFLGDERRDALEKYYAQFVEPTSVRGIPSYVLLMGFGVCAVVLRVIVKKGLLRRKWA